MNEIETEKLTKVYRGKKTPALIDLTLSVPRGEIFGFLGPNGAGKTTTIRILMTLLRPTTGSARVAGLDVLKNPMEAMRHVGFMPENPGFYSGLSGKQHLRYYASLYGLDRSRFDGHLNEVLQRVGLADAGIRKVKTYSLGMKRRLALAGALLSDPELLILDEPSLGLDPEGMAFVRSLLKELQQDGRTVFLSSHLLGEIEKVCTRVGILHRGKLLRVDAPREISKAFGGRQAVLEVETRNMVPAVLDELRALQGVAQVEVKDNTLRVFGALDDDTVIEVNRKLVAKGVSILSSRRVEPDLEAAFLALTEAKT